MEQRMKWEKTILRLLACPVDRSCPLPKGHPTLGGALTQPYPECIWLSEESECPDLYGHPDVHHLGCNVAEGQVADDYLLAP